MAVRALARSRGKAGAQFGQIPALEITEGDMRDVAGFASAMAGCDVVFHTAAYFRESYGGGKHWAMLKRINVDATAGLIAAAHAAGVRRFIHTSSIAVVNGPRGALITYPCWQIVEGNPLFHHRRVISILQGPARARAGACT